jgi:hypothetical protein
MSGRAHHSYSLFAVAVLVWFILVVCGEVGFAQQQYKLHSRPAQDFQLQAAKRPASLHITAKLSVKPKSYKKACPATFVFTGEIKANRSGTVEYRFMRSDGSRSGSSTLSFFEPGGQTVTDTWRLGDASLPSYEGWEAIEVVSPVRVESNKAIFRMDCRQEETPSARRKRR